MGYLHIENLYRRPDILECFCLEKIHGCSSHISYHMNKLDFHGGGESYESFTKLFDIPELTRRLEESFRDKHLVIYGESFGNKQQGMSKTYGKELRFLAFDVSLDSVWLDVPSAEGLVKGLGLGFVPYERGPLTLEWLNIQRDRPSLVAIADNMPREGVVIRPIHELQYKDGGRFIFKYKRPEFRETHTPREVDPNQKLIYENAEAVASEWVTHMRLKHVLQKTPYNSIQDTGNVIRAMQEDIRRESEGEFEWLKAVGSAIGKATVKLLQNIR